MIASLRLRGALSASISRQSVNWKNPSGSCLGGMARDSNAKPVVLRGAFWGAYSRPNWGKWSEWGHRKPLKTHESEQGERGGDGFLHRGSGVRISPGLPVFSTFALSASDNPECPGRHEFPLPSAGRRISRLKDVDDFMLQATSLGQLSQAPASCGFPRFGAHSRSRIRL